MIKSKFLEMLMTDYIKEKEVITAIMNLIAKMDKHFTAKPKLRDCQNNPLTAMNAMDECVNMIDGADKTLSIMRELLSKVNHELLLKKDKLRNLQLQLKNSLNQEEQLNILKKYSTKAEKEEYKKVYMEISTIKLDEEVKSITLDKNMAENYVKDAENQRDKVYAYFQAVKKAAGQ